MDATAAPTEPKDIRGKVIKPGQTIIYPIRLGSKMWQNIAKVTVVGQGKMLVNRIHPTSRANITLRSLAQIIVLEDAK